MIIDNQKLVNNVHRLAYLMQKRGEKEETLEIYGWDGLKNLVKLSYNLKNYQRLEDKVQKEKELEK